MAGDDEIDRVSEVQFREFPLIIGGRKCISRQGHCDGAFPRRKGYMIVCARALD